MPHRDAVLALTLSVALLHERGDGCISPRDGSQSAWLVPTGQKGVIAHGTLAIGYEATEAKWQADGDGRYIQSVLPAWNTRRV